MQRRGFLGSILAGLAALFGRRAEAMPLDETTTTYLSDSPEVYCFVKAKVDSAEEGWIALGPFNGKVSKELRHGLPS